ncbi:MAG: ABC transporter permease [Dehalococcoidia bacterium]
MNARVTFATAARVLHQLRNDRRTLALLWGVPILLQALVKFVFWDQDPIFQRLGPPLLGVFPMTSMFLVTSVAMLRERTSGTLERLLTMPMAKLDLLVGYAIAFGLLAAIQATLAAAVAFGLLGLETGGPAWAVVLLAVLNAVLGMAMGLLLSAFASTEFQAVQFLPAFLLPQFLLCGLLGPRERMLPALEAASNAMPMTYAYDALTRVARGDSLGGGLGFDVAVLAAVTALALALGAATLRRTSG